jgi:hypothetical protein
MRTIFTLLGILWASFVCGQADNGTIKVIAKRISEGEGSKIHIAQYQVIKVLTGNVSEARINVGYSPYETDQPAPDTALLTLIPYQGNATPTHYYYFPDYDAKRGMQAVKISTVSFDFWEGCETREGLCPPLTLERPSTEVKWFFFMPCGGTRTDVSLTRVGDVVPLQTVGVGHSQCPPVFDLTNVADGKYRAYMLSCGLGGGIDLNLITKN